MDDPLNRNEKGYSTLILVQVVKKIVGSENIFATQYKVKLAHNKEGIVNATSLYAFSRFSPQGRGANQETPSECLVAVVNSQDQENHNNGFLPEYDSEDLKKIVDSLIQDLNEAWKLSKSEWKKVIKRLQLHWHPDKNPDKKEFCTKVFQYLMNLIAKLEKGEKIENFEINEDGNQNATESEHNLPELDYPDLIRDRARMYNHQEEEHQNRSRRSNYQRSEEQYFSDFKYQPNPQPGEAQRWMQQANHDLDAAANDGLPDSSMAYEWICIKCHHVRFKIFLSRYAILLNILQ